MEHQAHFKILTPERFEKMNRLSRVPKSLTTVLEQFQWIATKKGIDIAKLCCVVNKSDVENGWRCPLCEEEGTTATKRQGVKHDSSEHHLKRISEEYDIDMATLGDIEECRWAGCKQKFYSWKRDEHEEKTCKYRLTPKAGVAKAAKLYETQQPTPPLSPFSLLSAALPPPPCDPIFKETDPWPSPPPNTWPPLPSLPAPTGVPPPPGGDAFARSQNSSSSVRTERPVSPQVIDLTAIPSSPPPYSEEVQPPPSRAVFDGHPLNVSHERTSSLLLSAEGNAGTDTPHSSIIGPLLFSVVPSLNGSVQRGMDDSQSFAIEGLPTPREEPQWNWSAPAPQEHAHPAPLEADSFETAAFAEPDSGEALSRSDSAAGRAYTMGTGAVPTNASVYAGTQASGGPFDFYSEWPGLAGELPAPGEPAPAMGPDAFTGDLPDELTVERGQTTSFHAATAEAKPAPAPHSEDTQVSDGSLDFDDWLNTMAQGNSGWEGITQPQPAAAVSHQDGLPDEQAPEWSRQYPSYVTTQEPRTTSGSSAGELVDGPTFEGAKSTPSYAATADANLISAPQYYPHTQDSDGRDFGFVRNSMPWDVAPTSDAHLTSAPQYSHTQGSSRGWDLYNRDDSTAQWRAGYFEAGSTQEQTVASGPSSPRLFHEQASSTCSHIPPVHHATAQESSVGSGHSAMGLVDRPTFGGVQSSVPHAPTIGVSDPTLAPESVDNRDLDGLLLWDFDSWNYAAVWPDAMPSVTQEPSVASSSTQAGLFDDLSLMGSNQYNLTGGAPGPSTATDGWKGMNRLN